MNAPAGGGAAAENKLAAVGRLRRDLRFRQLTRRLYRFGERPVGEALLAVAAGRDPLEVLEEYAQLDPEFVRYVGARDWPPLGVEGGMNVRAIPLADVVDDAAAQMRVNGINPAIVDEYARAMQEGATFPPILVFNDENAYHVPDGFHRVAAARHANLDEILADVRDGTARDAVLAAAGANSTHGIRRTNADKRHAIERLLADPEWSRWSDREIARACHADHKTVARVRRELTGEIPSERSVTYRDRHGNVGQMRVTGEIPSERPSLTERLLAKVPTEDLIAELQRRGLEVRDV